MKGRSNTNDLIRLEPQHSIVWDLVFGLRSNGGAVGIDSVTFGYGPGRATYLNSTPARANAEDLLVACRKAIAILPKNSRARNLLALAIINIENQGA